MIIKSVSEIGSSVIRSKARPVRRPNDAQVRKIIKDLTDSMRAHDLVGMAAPQIGKGLRIFVTEIRKTPFRKNVSDCDILRVFINPRITKYSGKKVSGYEGCGSVALGGLFGPVSRPERVTIHAHDQKGNNVILKASGLLARVIQHEMDHLNGVVFIDHVADTRELLGKNEYFKLKKKQST